MTNKIRLSAISFTKKENGLMAMAVNYKIELPEAYIEASIDEIEGKIPYSMDGISRSYFGWKTKTRIWGINSKGVATVNF